MNKAAMPDWKYAAAISWPAGYVGLVIGMALVAFKYGPMEALRVALLVVPIMYVLSLLVIKFARWTR